MLSTLQEHDRIYSESDYEWRSQHCPICGEKPQEFVGYRGGSAHRMKLGVRCEIWRCPGCDLIFPDPMPLPLNGLGQHYDVSPEDYFYGHEQDESSRIAEALVQQAGQILKLQGRMLDVGSGRGQIARAAKAAGWEVVAIEPSASFARSLRQAGIPVVEKPVEECVELADQSFDAIVLSAVLEHLYDPDRVTKSISRLLRRGGILFIDVPNERGLYATIGNFYERVRGTKATVNLSPTFAPYHVFGFTPRSLRKLLGKYDLQPIRWRVYRGNTPLPRRVGFVGSLESFAARMVNRASGVGELGSFIEAWAQKT